MGMLSKGSAMAALMAFLCLMLRRMPVLEEGILPYIALFLITSVSSMRVLRHSEKTQSDPQMLRENLQGTLALCAAALILCNRTILGFVLSVLNGIYQWLMAQLLKVIYLLFGGVAQLLERLIQYLKSLMGQNGDGLKNLNLDALNPSDLLVGADDFAKNVSDFVLVRVVFLILLAVFSAWVFYKIFFTRRCVRKVAGEYTEERETLKPSERRKRRSPFAQRSLLENIRLKYVRYLEKLQQKKVVIAPGDTTAQIEEKAGAVYPEEVNRQIRGIYARARYGDRYSPEDLQKLKELLKQLP